MLLNRAFPTRAVAWTSYLLGGNIFITFSRSSIPHNFLISCALKLRERMKRSKKNFALKKLCGCGEVEGGKFYPHTYIESYELFPRHTIGEEKIFFMMEDFIPLNMCTVVSSSRIERQRGIEEYFFIKGCERDLIKWYRQAKRKPARNYENIENS